MRPADAQSARWDRTASATPAATAPTTTAARRPRTYPHPRASPRTNPARHRSRTPAAAATNTAGHQSVCRPWGAARVRGFRAAAIARRPGNRRAISPTSQPRARVPRSRSLNAPAASPPQEVASVATAAATFPPSVSSRPTPSPPPAPRCAARVRTRPRMRSPGDWTRGVIRGACARASERAEPRRASRRRSGAPPPPWRGRAGYRSPR